MNLYEINTSIIQALEDVIDEETGEIKNEEAYQLYQELQLAQEEKIENIGLYIKNLESDAEQLKAEAKKFSERAKACERRSNWLREYLKSFLNGEKCASTRLNISYRKSKKVECSLEDISVLPSQFLKVTPELKKTEIKKFIEEGGTVEGCEVIESVSMIIK